MEARRWCVLVFAEVEASTEGEAVRAVTAATPRMVSDMGGGPLVTMTPATWAREAEDADGNPIARPLP